MPITTFPGNKHYTLGRGRLFIDRYPTGVLIDESTKGVGEIYIGNTPEINIASESENLDHFDSDDGVRVKDASVQLSFDQSMTFTTDNISPHNFAMAFLGQTASKTQAAAEDIEEEIVVKRGATYQLGQSSINPSGVRGIANVVVTDDETEPGTITMSGNYQVDLDLGRIYIEEDASDIADDDTIVVTYDTVGTSRIQIVSGSDSIYAALRFIANNPMGVNQDFYFPYVKLAPDGDVPLKGDEWLTVGFTAELLKKGNLERVYIDGRPVLVGGD